MVDLRSTLCEYCVKVNLQQLHVQYLMAIMHAPLYDISAVRRRSVPKPHVRW